MKHLLESGLLLIPALLLAYALVGMLDEFGMEPAPAEYKAEFQTLEYDIGGRREMVLCIP